MRIILAQIYQRGIVSGSLSGLRVLATVDLAHRLLLLNLTYLIKVVLIAICACVLKYRTGQIVTWLPLS